MLKNNLLILSRAFLPNSLQNYIRNSSFVAKSLKCKQYGEPIDVLEVVETTLEMPTGNQCLIKILAAPINPADINTIQGKYPTKLIFPAIPGSEFVAEVICVGDKVKKIEVGQRVAPLEPALGSWTTHAIVNENQLIPISDKIGLVEAATLTVNPRTAYRMLKDFVNLQPGDCIIQNGANSAAGQAVHQLCRAWGIQSVGIVRNRPDIDNLKQYLKHLGATEVLTEEEIRTTTIFKDNKLPKPRLAFNCVGGKSATEITRHLANKGVVVTYGGMSREPVSINTATFIFKDISFVGYWMTRWGRENRDTPENYKMYAELIDLMEKKQLVAPVHELVALSDYKKAVTGALNFKGFTGKKFILDMQC